MLRIKVVEDNSNTRALIRNHLVAIKAGAVSCYTNGSALLKRNEMVNADIIIIGMELENSYAGSDLIRHLARLKKLHQWVKVIFVTNATEKVRADLPLLGQKCDVIQKPISLKELSQSILACQQVCHIGKETFLQLNEVTDKKLISLVKKLPSRVKFAETSDSVKLIQCKLLMKLSRPTLIFSIIEKINDPELKHLVQMHYFFYFGQLAHLQQTIESTRKLNILKTKRDNFYLLQSVIERDYPTAKSTICEKKESDLHPPEVLLKSTLISLTEGFNPALDYLLKKRRVTLENHYFRSSVTVSILYLCFMQLLHKRDKHVKDKEVLALLHENCKEKSLKHAGNDFDSFVPFLRLAVDVINDEYRDNLAAAYLQLDELLENTINLEPTKRILMFIICVHLGDEHGAFQQMTAICALLADVEVSPEMIVNYLAYDLFIESRLGNEARASMLNRLGKHMFENRYPAVALRLFYRAYKTSPDSISNVLNLLSALITTKLQHYIDTGTTELFEQLQSKTLSNKQQAVVEELKTRIKSKAS